MSWELTAEVTPIAAATLHPAAPRPRTAAAALASSPAASTTPGMPSDAGTARRSLSGRSGSRAKRANSPSRGKLCASAASAYPPGPHPNGSSAAATLATTPQMRNRS